MSPKPKIQRTVENEICSLKKFKKLCIDTVSNIKSADTKFFIVDETIRHLRLSMILTVESRDLLADALDVVLRSITSTIVPRGKTTRIFKADIGEWLVDDVGLEWVGDVSLGEDGVHGVRKILDRRRVNGVTLYLVDWEPGWEPRSNINQTLIVQFEKARRALVARTYIEVEAAEAGK